MSRVVVIASDGAERRALADVIVASGHQVDAFDNELSALAGWGSQRPALVLASLARGTDPAAELWDTLGGLDFDALVWVGGDPAHALPLLNSGRGRGHLVMPVAPSALEALVRGDAVPGEAAVEWNGPDALEAVDGPIGRYPLPRVLFLVHRISATGTLTVRRASGEVQLGVQNGRVVAWTGLPGVVARGLGEGAAGSPDSLVDQLGFFIAQGQRPDVVMEAAAWGLGAELAETVDEPEGVVRWTSGPWGQGAPMPLPLSLPQILAAGLADVRGPREVRSALGARRRDRVEPTPPLDAPQTQWGLPPAALRLVREAGRAASLGNLLGAGGGESDAAWQALDLVLQLGLVRLLPPPDDNSPPSAPRKPTRSAAPTRDAAAPRQSQAASSRPPGDTAAETTSPPPPDTEEQRLRGILDTMRRQQPHEVLGVEGPDDASVEGLDALFLARSTEFHPDRFSGEGARAQRVAQAIFTRINDAREKLRDSDRRIELVERLRAEAAGQPWASADDKRRAILIGKQGEIALKRGSWEEADEKLQEATATDPTEFVYAFQALHAGWKSGRIAAQEAVNQLLAFDKLTRGQQADCFALAGEIMLREEMNEDDAYTLLGKAVERNPDLVGPQRRLRLREMRQRKADEATRQKNSKLAGLLRWGRKATGGEDSGDS